MKRLIAGLISLSLLGLLLWKVDREALAANFRNTNWGWFALALLMFVPQILVMAWRWQKLVRVFAPLSLREAVSLILASQTMNLVLPSKMGDLSKGYFLKRTGTLDLKRAMNVVVFEKMLDVAALAAFMLLGVAILFSSGRATDLQRHAALVAGFAGLFAVAAVTAIYLVPPERIPGFRWMLNWLERRPKLRKIHSLASSGHEVVELLQRRGTQRGLIVALSVFIWVLHLVQIYFFFRCLDANVPLGQFFTMVPLAIFTGLLPVSIAGFGTRDAALVVLFPQVLPATMVAVAMYVNLRYLLPAAAGVPFLHRYLTLTRQEQAEAAATATH